MISIIYHDGATVFPCPPGQAAGFEDAAGNGEIHVYPLLKGVSAMLMRLEMEAYTEVRSQPGLLEINFCVDGRFETSFSLREQVLLKPGDLAISCYDGLHGSSSESHFPLGYYEGICLEVEPKEAMQWIRRFAPAFSIDFDALKQNLLGTRTGICTDLPAPGASMFSGSCTRVLTIRTQPFCSSRCLSC